MTPLVFLLAAACGGLGAAVRYLLDVAVGVLTGARFPWGVLLINVTGSFLLGLVIGMLPDAAFTVGTGFLGGYTTFSTAMIDAVALWRDGKRPASVGNLLGMLVLAIAAAGLGLAVAP